MPPTLPTPTSLTLHPTLTPLEDGNPDGPILELGTDLVLHGREHRHFLIVPLEKREHPPLRGDTWLILDLPEAAHRVLSSWAGRCGPCPLGVLQDARASASAAWGLEELLLQSTHAHTPPTPLPERVWPLELGAAQRLWEAATGHPPLHPPVRLKLGALELWPGLGVQRGALQLAAPGGAVQLSPEQCRTLVRWLGTLDGAGLLG